jgi:nucleoid-associated protein YgaU
VSALEKHLQETGSHEHLTFHRGCPVCRESRLAGRVVGHPLVPERMRDGVAVAAVVASAVATSARSAGVAEEPHAIPAPPVPEPVPLPAEPVVRIVPDEVVAGLGDTLWTIAADQLGGRSSSAAIAGEVNRLWMLNADRIASGEPQLIQPGQRLRVR